MRALRESASRGERHQARHMRQETGQHDKAGDAPVEEQAVGPSMPNERRGDAARSMGAGAVSLPAAAINATTKPGSAVVPRKGQALIYDRPLPRAFNASPHPL